MNPVSIASVSGLFILYVVLILTLAMTTFRNGHRWLGIAGFFLPVLWLVGALMKPAPHAHRAQAAHRAHGVHRAAK